MVDLVLRYDRWMAETPAVPKLLLTVDNGVGLGSPEIIGWAAENFAASRSSRLGQAGTIRRRISPRPSARP